MNRTVRAAESGAVRESLELGPLPERQSKQTHPPPVVNKPQTPTLTSAILADAAVHSLSSTLAPLSRALRVSHSRTSKD